MDQNGERRKSRSNQVQEKRHLGELKMQDGEVKEVQINQGSISDRKEWERCENIKFVPSPFQVSEELMKIY